MVLSSSGASLRSGHPSLDGDELAVVRLEQKVVTFPGEAIAHERLDHIAGDEFVSPSASAMVARRSES